jgi:hypothetical protein
MGHVRHTHTFAIAYCIYVVSDMSGDGGLWFARLPQLHVCALTPFSIAHRATWCTCWLGRGGGGGVRFTVAIHMTIPVAGCVAFANLLQRQRETL